MSLKIIIIGGVAAGPKAAAKIVRLNPEAEVTLLEKGKFISYAGCGLPYYVSGVVKEQKDLMSTPIGVLRDPAFFQNVKNVKVLTETEALEIDRARKRVRARRNGVAEDFNIFNHPVYANPGNTCIDCSGAGVITGLLGDSQSGPMQLRSEEPRPGVKSR